MGSAPTTSSPTISEISANQTLTVGSTEEPVASGASMEPAGLGDMTIALTRTNALAGGTGFAGGVRDDGLVFQIVKTRFGYASPPTIPASFNGSEDRLLSAT